MHSKTTKLLIKKLADKYGHSEESVRHVINAYYDYVAVLMREGVSITGEFKDIRIRFLGKFLVPPYLSVTEMMEAVTLEKMKKMKNEYSITLQGEPDVFVENNEAFFFLMEEDGPTLKKGDRIEVVYNKPERLRKKDFHNPILDMEILDGKHPFYKGAIDMEGKHFVFFRNGLDKIRV